VSGFGDAEVGAVGDGEVGQQVDDGSGDGLLRGARDRAPALEGSLDGPCQQICPLVQPGRGAAGGRRRCGGRLCRRA
jgi:hypothetical protein